MKKLLVMLLALMMIAVSVTAIAEDKTGPLDEKTGPLEETGPLDETDPQGEETESDASGIKLSEKIIGLWYINQIVSDGKAYDVSQLPNQNMVEFGADNTGVIYAKDDQENTKTQIAWKEDENGQLWFQEENTQVPMQIQVYENPDKSGEYYLVLGDDENNYVLNREPTAPVNFAPVKKAADIKEFDGKYALTYLAGDGYTLKAENAADDLAALGIKSTEINIENGLVEFGGGEPRAYTFDANDGSLNMVVDEKVEFLNIHIFKTESGIALNWFDLTFYAEPVAAQSV